MIVCSCFAVSSAKLQEVLEQGADSVAAVGRACCAGTDCGSCVSQIREIIEGDASHLGPRACQAPACADDRGAANVFARLVIRAA
jgi:bacterioferritin-associated ferredoxin